MPFELLHRFSIGDEVYCPDSQKHFIIKDLRIFTGCNAYLVTPSVEGRPGFGFSFLLETSLVPQGELTDAIFC